MPAIALEDPHSLARVLAFISKPGPDSAVQLVGSGSFNSPLGGVVAMQESLLVVVELCEPCMRNRHGRYGICLKHGTALSRPLSGL